MPRQSNATKPLFSARHFRIIADAIANADRYDAGDLIGLSVVVEIRKALAADNPKFNRELFDDAAGLTADEREES